MPLLTRPSMATSTRSPSFTASRLWTLLRSSSKWWRSIYRRYKPKLHRRTRFLIEGEKAASFEHDRSKCIYEIVADLHHAEASADEIAAIVWVNPYFISKCGKRLGKLHEELGRILPKLGDPR